MHRLSDEVFLATHESGNTRGTAEFTTMPRVKRQFKATELWRQRLYTRSVRRGGERVVLGDHRATRSEQVGQHVDGRTARRDNARP